MRRRERPLMLIVVCVLLLSISAVRDDDALGGSDEAGRGELIGQTKSTRVYFRSVDPSDLMALRQWAEKMCSGHTLAGFASSLGVAPSLDAVVDVFAKRLPDRERALIHEVFGEKLQ
jgi:hypothetical protein